MLRTALGLAATLQDLQLKFSCEQPKRVTDVENGLQQTLRGE